MIYRFVTAPENYPGLTYEYGNRILEHHYVWWLNTGECVPDGYLIHHRNEDKLDNEFDNLELMLWGDHTRQHRTKHIIVGLSCDKCGAEFSRSTRKMVGKTNFYCSKRCSAASTSGNCRKN